MESGDPCVLEGSTASTTGAVTRRRPLYTCGASILGIAYCVCTKAQQFRNGPLGSLSNTFLKLISIPLPLVYPLLYQWLAGLTFADDYILRAETRVEKIIPPATCIFNKIDELVISAESLPTKLDGALNRFPQFPLLDWVISWLNFFVCALTHWGSDVTKEKEIMVDANCRQDCDPGAETTEEAQCQETRDLLQKQRDQEAESYGKRCNDRNGFGVHASRFSFDSLRSTQYGDAMTSPAIDTKHCSYKDVLQKGTKENAEKNRDCSLETSSAEGPVGEEKAAHSGTDDDPILNLFEASWHNKQFKK